MSLVNMGPSFPAHYLADAACRYSKLRSKLTVGQMRLSDLANILLRQFRSRVCGADHCGSVTMSVSRVFLFRSPSHAMRRMRVYAQTVVARSVASVQVIRVRSSQEHQGKPVGVVPILIPHDVSIAGAGYSKGPYNTHVTRISGDDVFDKFNRLASTASFIHRVKRVSVPAKDIIVGLAISVSAMTFVAVINYALTIMANELPKWIAISLEHIIVVLAIAFCFMLLTTSINAAKARRACWSITAAAFGQPRFQATANDSFCVATSATTEPSGLLIPTLPCVPENCQSPEDAPSDVDNARRTWFSFNHDVTPTQLRNREALREYQSPTLLAL